MAKFNDHLSDDKVANKGFRDRNPKKIKIKPKEADEMRMIKPPHGSSNIAEMGFRASTGVMHIKFKDKRKDGKLIPGSIYKYTPILPEQWEALLSAPSHGTYLNTHFKDNPNILIKKL